MDSTVRRRCASFAMTLPFVCATLLHAQSVEGTVVDRVTGTPLAGVLLTAHDSTGRERARMISGASGRFRLPTRVGPFKVSVARIGYVRWFSTSFRATGTEVLSVRLEVDQAPRLLPELLALDKTRCRVSVGDRADVLWDEARTAMGAAYATVEAGDVSYLISVARRRLDANEAFLWDVARTYRSAARWPIRALAADSLFDFGFVQPTADPDDLIYYGADPEVLFDPRFAERHCMKAVPGPPGTSLTGVAFWPADVAMVPDISGTLWLDEVTRQLHALEFFYSRPRYWAPAGSAGGRVEFTALRDGRWLTVRWRMLAPIPRRAVAGVDIDGYVEGDAGVMVALGEGGDTLWRGPPLTGQNLVDPVVAKEERPQPVRLRVVDTKGRKARRLVAQNRSDSTRIVRALLVEQCVNVLERCARYPLDETLAPREERTLMELSPWRSGRPWKFTARLEIDL